MDVSADGVEWRSDVQASIRAMDEGAGSGGDSASGAEGNGADGGQGRDFLPQNDTAPGQGTGLTPHPPPPPAVQPVSTGSQGMAATFPLIFQAAAPSSIPPIVIPGAGSPTPASTAGTSTPGSFLSSIESWVVNNPFIAAGIAVLAVLLLRGED